MKSQIIRCAIVTTLLLSAQNLYAAQFGVGLGDAADETASTQQVQTERQERGGSITIAWSANNDELSGFSNKTGRWQKLKIEPQEKIQPNCVEFVGAVRLKDGIAAYSGETGTWDVVHLPQTSMAMPAVSPDVAQFKEGEHFYAFSASTGRWTSPTDPAMKTLTIEYLSPKHIPAAELHARLIEWMQTVPASEVNGSIQWLDGVLSLLPRTKEWQEAAEAEVAKLDVPGASTGAPGMDAGHGFGGGGSIGLGGGLSGGSGREVSSSGLIITWSENKDEIRGFSNSKGEWDVLKVEKQQQIVPVVGDDVAAVRLGNSMAAFSATLAQWDVIPLSEGSNSFPVVFGGYVKVEDNGHLYTFADAKGQWTSPTDPELQPATKQLSGIGTRTPFDREAFDQWLHSLPPYEGRGIQLTFRGNEVTVHTTRQSWMKEVLSWIEMAHGATDSGNAEPSASIRPGRSVDQIEAEISELREEFKRLELAVGDGIKKVASTKDAKEEHQRELRELVEKSFDFRQKLQRLEAQRMKLKLQLIETNLDIREKAREAIIERRVAELLSGDSRQPAQLEANKTGDTNVPGSPITGTPIGLAGPPHIPIDERAGLESGQTTTVKTQWPLSSETAKELRASKEAVHDLLDRIVRDKQIVEQWSKPLEKLQTEGVATADVTEAQRLNRIDVASKNLRYAQASIDRLQRVWNSHWSAYQSKLRLLKLDVDEANVELQKRQVDFDQRAEANKKHPSFSATEMAQTSASVSSAKIHLERAEELLKLYANIEAQEPDLNPDYVSK